MLDAESGRQRSPDVLVVPFIFVPYGDPVPAEWLARHSDPIRVPATFVPDQASFEQGRRRSGFSWQPSQRAAPTFGSGAPHAVANFDVAEAPPPGSAPAALLPNAPDGDHAITTYLRVNEFLDRLGLGHSGRDDARKTHSDLG